MRFSSIRAKTSGFFLWKNQMKKLVKVPFGAVIFFIQFNSAIKSILKKHKPFKEFKNYGREQSTQMRECQMNKQF
ncbi:hypothetical protein COT07_01670 [Candidatus Woesearchaeota archaeon CG07_land_8_20_14_0_80_44_23]|nr:MAG: hypothetical protein COT07_01670 [Candidatus Woesearchaeota archaeon CG07_land_8_20_14_0_80_44_23]